MGPQPVPESKRWDRTYAVDLLALLLILAALLVALTKTAGLPAPPDTWDHFRDIAQAQTVRDGAPLSDQYYRDEWVWYNPLLPWTLALGSAITGTRIEVFHVRAGPVLNLLGPLAFYLLGVRWIGRTAAFIALAVYLFFATGDGPGWAYATYSPWLYSNNFAAGIFFAAAFALQMAADRPTLTRLGTAGALMGLTFLAHTAPALILVIVACAAFARRWPWLLTTGAAAVVVALPFLYSIGLQYQFAVVNTRPLSWEWVGVLTLDTLPQFLKDNAMLVGLAAFGAVITTARLLLVWLASAAVLLLFALLPTAPLIPAFHFWKWTTAAMALLAGTTLAWLCSTAPAHAWAALRQTGRPPRGVNFIAIFLTGTAVVWHWHTYVNLDDFQARPQSIPTDAVDFLRELTGPNDVVLGNNQAVKIIIGPAGRKTVALDGYLANPYVLFSPRAQARRGMLSAIEAADVQTYNDLARQYNVTAGVFLGFDACAAAFRMLPPRARFGDVCITGYGHGRPYVRVVPPSVQEKLVEPPLQ